MPVSEGLVRRYRDALLALLPHGRAITKQPLSHVERLMEAISVEPARLHERTVDLLAEALPTSTVELLAEWFKAFGSPITGVVTDEDKRRAIAARILRLRGHSLPHMGQLSSVFGYPAPVITHYQPFTAGSGAGDSLSNDPWAHHIDVEWPSGEHDSALAAAFLDRLRSHASATFTFVTGLGGDLPLDLG